MTDEEAIGRVLAGDAEAFGILVEKYQGPVYRIALHLAPDAHEAEDAAQEAFLSAFQHLREWDPGRGCFRAWLFSTARNRALDLRRKRKPALGECGSAAASGPGPASAAEGGEFLDRLDRALDSLPTGSMAPSVRPGDLVLANKIAYREGPVKRGDVVVFPHPDRGHQRQIKRVIGLPGDEIEITPAGLKVNGATLDLSAEGQIANGGSPELSGEVFEERNGEARYRILVSGGTAGEEAKAVRILKLTVPHGHCFVLGDNRGSSLDSRDYGPVPLAGILGRVDRVVYPRSKSLAP